MKFSFCFLLLPVFFLFSGCHKPCNQDQVADLRLSEADLKMNPYTGTEILTYKTFEGDTIYFPSGVRKTEGHTYYEYDSETAKIDHDGCQGNYFYSEYNWMVKSDDFSDSRLDVNLGFRYSLRDPNPDKGFFLYFWIRDPQLLCFWGDYNFKDSTLLSCPGSSPGTAYRDSVVSFNPELILGTKKFYNVYELYCQNPDTRDTAWISTAYYNTREGLVGFKTTYGKTWYLDNVR